ncbi:poly(A) polymerase [uncultured Streptomyces sp.]|uniref:poly(A) polymerase n=1 Tax=uncultured Streptomyces sp. TaxID=174707 RepID=UPI0026018197|nr:poly(A) polymerase [uncultured Streptomyces sp.]
MRTSDEIYHRVRWDARFDPERFVIGVAQRGREPKRMRLARFTPGGEVPWHRVLFFEADGEVVWDRASGLDRLDTTEAGRVRATHLLPAPYFAARTAYAFTGGRWEPVGGTRPQDAVPAGRAQDAVPAGRAQDAVPAGRALSVLTWNTLWDRYDSDRIDTARRRPLLLDTLRAAGADVVALQEVEPALRDMILNAPWIREGYTVAVGFDVRDVADCGLLLLSRLPVRGAGLHVLGPHKAMAVAVLEGPDGPVTVAATHLSSDHSPEGAVRRDRELADIATGVAGLDGDVLLLGDFNDGGGNPQARLGLADAWSVVHGPDDDTPTFDPAANPLAAVGSLTGRVSRLDRVLYRVGSLRPRTASLVGDVPEADGLFASDHYGVRVTFAAGRDDGDDGPENGSEDGSQDGSECGSEDGGAEVVVAVTDAFPEGCVHLVGSRRTGCALPGADVDLVAALPAVVDAAELRRRLPRARDVREVTGARVPGLRFALRGLKVDLVLVATGAVPPGEAVARRAELGDAAAVALSAVSDARALLDAVADAPDPAAYTALTRAVKAWARAKGLDSAAFGGLPGLAWSVLAARTVAEAGDLPPTALLRHFFATWAAWDWTRPVACGPVPRAYGYGYGGGSEAVPGPAAPLTVLTPTAPVRSCTGQVSAAFRDLVAEELFLAWEQLESLPDNAPAPPAALRTPPSRERHRAWAVVSVAPGEDEGRFRGRVLALLAALADAGSPDATVWPRPVGSGPDEVRYAVGLGATPPSPARLADIGTELLRGLRGARLARPARPDTGEVPDWRG